MGLGVAAAAAAQPEATPFPRAVAAPLNMAFDLGSKIVKLSISVRRPIKLEGKPNGMLTPVSDAIELCPNDKQEFDVTRHVSSLTLQTASTTVLK